MHAIWKIIWQFLLVLKTQVPDDPTIPFPGTHRTEMWTYVHQKSWTRMFIAKLFRLETTQKPINGQMVFTPSWYFHTMEYNLATRRSKLQLCATKWMNPPNRRVRRVTAMGELADIVWAKEARRKGVCTAWHLHLHSRKAPREAKLICSVISRESGYSRLGR